MSSHIWTIVVAGSGNRHRFVHILYLSWIGILLQNNPTTHPWLRMALLLAVEEREEYRGANPTSYSGYCSSPSLEDLMMSTITELLQVHLVSHSLYHKQAQSVILVFLLLACCSHLFRIMLDPLACCRHLSRIMLDPLACCSRLSQSHG